MLSSVLNSDRAIEVNILIMRSFVKLREMISTHKDLAKKLEELEQKYDSQFKMVFDAIRRTPRTAMRDEYEITDSIQILIDDGYTVKTSLCVAKDRNVTAPADLLEINLEAIDRLGLDKHVGADVLIDPNAIVRHAVIGSRCCIGKGARIVDSVLFRDVTVPEGAQIERAIVTEQGVLRIG